MKPAALAPLAIAPLLASVAAGQSFTLVPGLPPNGGSRIYGISADGQTAAGDSAFGTAFRYSASGGRQDLIEPGVSLTWGNAISGDGSTVVGEGTGGAYVWRGPANYQIIGRQSGYTNGAAEGVSGDGSVVVGRSYIPDSAEPSQAFRWTASGGLQPLGFTRPGHYHSEAFAISRDGSVIVGISRAGAGDAFVWTQSGGMTALPSLPNSNSGSGAFGVNATGDIIVGYSGPGALWTKWEDGLPTLLGGADGIARAVSDNGRVVVGQIDTGTLHAGIWTPERGPELLSDYLASFGISIPANVSLLNATAVSADGRTIAGYTGLPGQVRQGFIAVVPSPATAGILAAAFLAAPRRRRSRRSASPELRNF